MNLQTLEHDWQQVLDSTKHLEHAANEQDWEHVAELAAKRHSLITQHFDIHPVGPDTAEFYQQHLSSFLAKEEQLQQLAATARKAAMKASLKLHSNKKAVNAYRQM